MPESPLRSLYEGAGVAMGEISGWCVPRHFAEPAREYVSLREKAALFDVSFRRRIRVAGGDRTEFLHGMLTQDVKSLSPGGGAHAVLLTDRGRVVADLRVLVTAEAIFLDIDARCCERAVAGLERLIVADDVEICPPPLDEGALSIQGPRALAILGDALGEDPGLPAPYSHREVTLGSASLRLARLSETGEDGVALVGRGPALVAGWQRLVGAGAQPAGLETLEVARVEAGIPWCDVDIDPARIVLEVGLEEAISFDKGCYLGQEVVERGTSRGHVNRRLLGLRLAGDALPPPRSPVRAGDAEAGWVTSAVLSPALGCGVALGYVRREWWTPGTAVEIEVGPRRLEAAISSLPFVSRRFPPQ